MSICVAVSRCAGPLSPCTGISTSVGWDGAAGLGRSGEEEDAHGADQAGGGAAGGRKAKDGGREPPGCGGLSMPSCVGGHMGERVVIAGGLNSVLAGLKMRAVIAELFWLLAKHHTLY